MEIKGICDNCKKETIIVNIHKIGEVTFINGRLSGKIESTRVLCDECFLVEWRAKFKSVEQ